MCWFAPNSVSLPITNLSIGARSPSQFTGYETLPITLTHDSKSQVINFLISTDSTKLAHLDTFDLTKDPADAIPIAGRPIRGNPAAKVTVINFDDLECPYCAMMHQELYPGTLAHYKDLVRFVYKDDPIPELHPWAMHAAVDANCLAAQSGQVYLDLRGLPSRSRAGNYGPGPRRGQELCRAGPDCAPGGHAGQARSNQPRRLPCEAGRNGGASLDGAGGKVGD